MTSKLGPALAQRIETARSHDRLEVQIFLRRDPPAPWDFGTDATEAPDRSAVAQKAQEVAHQNQERFLAEIAPLVEAGGFRELWRHWINDSIGAEVSPEALREILERPDVERVEIVARARIEDLLHGVLEPPNASPALPPAAPTVAWQVRYVNAPLLWSHGLRGEGVLVAVIDTGIQFDHPDLKDHLWDGGQDFPIHGFDFDAPDRDPRDEDGHGTACAGLIAGDGSSGLVTGIAPEARLMALRVGGREAQAWSAFQFAIDHGADVISMSMGWAADKNPDHAGWRVACELLLKAGVVHVCSAGNDGDIGFDATSMFAVPHNISVPASCPPPWLHPIQRPGGRSSAITCGETDNADRRVISSGRGPCAWGTAPFTDYPFQPPQSQGLLKPDLCAPGTGSETCNWKFGVFPSAPPYVSFGFTSASAATVAGCAALLVQAAKRSGKPVLPQRIQQALEESAVPIAGQTTKQNNLGSGRIDVFAAFEFGAAKGWWS